RPPLKPVAGVLEARSQAFYRRATARRALQGLLLAVGAPLGWLLLRVGIGVSPGEELASNLWLYAYMFLATAVAFILFGVIGGRREEQLERLATTDSLTRLRNHRYFWQRLQEAVAQSRRGEQGLGLAILDIDHFKRVNDDLGHSVGDRVLEAIGRAMRREARAGETAARIGGEELALILPGADLEETREAAERIRRAASREVGESAALPGSRSVTLSAGIATIDSGTGSTPEELFFAADRALYRAKAKGRDRVETSEQ
ncbi:MAG: GGDEF domain-containing protein, partial [Thermoanaerobaculia bacterium]|nr:GGDEF domain-containing protein [Thermoanaerobaculia bacterium]